jgi:hypothetical protein
VGDLPGPGVLSPAGEFDGLLDVREVHAEPVDVDGLEGAGLEPNGLAFSLSGRDRANEVRFGV